MTVTNHFQQQIIQHQPYLSHLAKKFTPMSADAEDLVQETVIKLLQNEDKFQTGTNFKAWCSIVLRNTFINGYRKTETRAPQMALLRQINAQKTSNNEGAAQLAVEELERTIEGLSDTIRLPFLMFYQGYTYEEIAEQLGVPMGTVKSRIFLARKALRQRIQVPN
ncbi:MAG: sigma-70 family RNA polymerase sigma factor [Bacteroidota bacterium]